MMIKKNQLTLLVLALMLITAGYLNYNSNANANVATGTELASIGDATFVSSNAIISNNEIEKKDNTNIISSDLVENTSNNSTDTNETISTNADIKNDNSDYYASSRLDRDKMYSQILETNQKVLDSSNTSSNQKDEAQKEINNINTIKNAIMITENLIKTKGFDDCIVYSNDNSINVIIKKEELSKEDTAQIQSIVAREMKAKISNIHIMAK